MYLKPLFYGMFTSSKMGKKATKNCMKKPLLTLSKKEETDIQKEEIIVQKEEIISIQEFELDKLRKHLFGCKRKKRPDNIEENQL